MFITGQFRGAALQAKQLCLTFDDGPGVSEGGFGPKTLELAEYLSTEGIAATFFVVGTHAVLYPGILSGLKQLGHFVGAHTYTHPHLPRVAEGQDMLHEFSALEPLIAAHLQDETIYFRAPYGDWDPYVALWLNENLNTAARYKGPYHWDIDVWDWCHWSQGRSAAACSLNYLQMIKNYGKGIVLMHDSSADDPVGKAHNLTLDTIKLLIPQLKAEGYQFIGIDQVPC